MRRTYVWNGEDWVDAATFRRRRKANGVQVVPDLQPYRSIVTGEIIGGRRQHRDHLRAHGLVEVGNEKLSPSRPGPLPPAINDVRTAVEMVRSGYRPPPPGRYRDD